MCVCIILVALPVDLQSCSTPGLMVTIESVQTFQRIDEKYILAFDRKLVILVRRSSVLTGFCPVSCGYHKPCLPFLNFGWTF